MRGFWIWDFGLRILFGVSDSISVKSMIEEILIQRSTELLGGAPVFAGTRVPVQTLISYLEEGDTLDEFLHDFPAVIEIGL